MNQEISRVCYIYGLSDPLSGVVRYIGRTIDPSYRVKDHLKFKKPSTHKEAWLFSLRKLGLDPEIQIIEVTTEIKAAEREIFWIAEYRSRGFNLTNSTDGGEGILGYTHNIETRKRMSEAHTGLPGPGLGWIPSDETRTRMSEASIRNWTEERKNSQIERLKLFWTPKRRKEHSEKMKGNQTRNVPWTEERRLAASRRMIGNNNAAKKVS